MLDKNQRLEVDNKLGDISILTQAITDKMEDVVLVGKKVDDAVRMMQEALKDLETMRKALEVGDND
mgnify:CR=1 FL=1